MQFAWTQQVSGCILEIRIRDKTLRETRYFNDVTVGKFINVIFLNPTYIFTYCILYFYFRRGKQRHMRKICFIHSIYFVTSSPKNRLQLNSCVCQSPGLCRCPCSRVLNPRSLKTLQGLYKSIKQVRRTDWPSTAKLFFNPSFFRKERRKNT